MVYYYTYIVNSGTITRAGVATQEKIFKEINFAELPVIKIVAVYDNFNDAMKYAIKLGFKLLPTAAVKCNETGNYFINANEAAHWANIPRGNMNKHLRRNGLRNKKTSDGLTFDYVNKEDK